MSENHPDIVSPHLLTRTIRFRGDVSIIRNTTKGAQVLIKSYELRNSD